MKSGQFYKICLKIYKFWLTCMHLLRYLGRAFLMNFFFYNLLSGFGQFLLTTKENKQIITGHMFIQPIVPLRNGDGSGTRIFP